jgi:hypothetical protein
MHVNDGLKHLIVWNGGSRWHWDCLTTRLRYTVVILRQFGNMKITIQQNITFNKSSIPGTQGLFGEPLHKFNARRFFFLSVQNIAGTEFFSRGYYRYWWQNLFAQKHMFGCGTTHTCIWAALVGSDGWNWICAFVYRIGLVRHIDKYKRTLSEYWQYTRQN